MRAAWREWRLGRRYGFPRCCVARFVFDHLTGQHNCAIRRGTVPLPSDPESRYVPCGRHRGKAPGWRRYGEGRRPQEITYVGFVRAEDL
jgi:hypothetical protein